MDVRYLTCKPSALIDKLKELAVNDPYSGKTVTGVSLPLPTATG